MREGQVEYYVFITLMHAHKRVTWASCIITQ